VTEAETGIRVQGLARRFDGLEAVRGLSLEIAEGELFGLLGPNGAGKTTTLSMLATLLAPSQGDASIFGWSLRRNPRQVRRLVGLAPQEVSIYPHLSGTANVEFFGRLYGLHGSRLREETAHALDSVGLTERAGDPAGTYSGGTLRRLNLACSLVHRPRLLLLDEPTAGVDPQSRDRLLEVIRSLASNRTTVLYTTHYMEEAQRLCDRIAIMDQGKIIAEGELDALLRIGGVGDVIELSGDVLTLDERRLSAVPGLLSSERSEGTIRLYVERAAAALGPLGALLSEMESGVTGGEVHRVELERVFMHLTGRALRD
jgi:ABC-2 type transport system ATP-binding protein